MRFSTVLIISIVCLINDVFGQTARPVDSSFVYAARNQATALYEQTVRSQAHVYKGNQYINQDRRIKIHPYYAVDSLQTGEVIYEGVRYRDVALLYDIVRDELVVQPPEGGYRLRLDTDKITQLSLGPHRFTRLVGDSVAGIRTGFYEIIYDGKAKALAKRIKTIREDISGGTYTGNYLQKDRFIVQKDGAFYDVQTKRSILNLFHDQAKELRRYIRANHLKFNDQKREEAISRITQRYDELTR